MNIHPLSRLWQYIIPHKLLFFGACISSTLNKLCDIVPELLIGISIDVVVHQQTSCVARFCGITNPLHQLYAVGVITATLWILESVFEYCYLILWRKLSQRLQHTLRISTYHHLQSLDISYFEHKTTGGLLSIINDDIAQLELFLSEGPNAIIQLAINILVIGSIFFWICPRVAVLTLLPIPFVILIAYYFQRKLATLYEAVREQTASLAGHIAARLMGIATIKSYVTETHETASLTQESKIYQQINHAASRLNAAYIPIVRMGVLSGFIMSLLVGGTLALQGTLSISFYSVLVFLTQRFLWPFTTLTTTTDMYERAMASARRVFAILNQKISIHSGTQELPDTKINGHIALHNISFGYSTTKKLFSNFSLDIPAHKTVAFVGSTGSGKSTITKLLLRFYNPEEGTILLDGEDITKLSLSSLRKHIGLVSQETYLLNTTIADNIRYGTPLATEEMIFKAARQAQIHEFILTLPQGYQTVLSENGKNLSGGQRQRIAIARAIVKNPSLFIFDEATSALDNETEVAVQQAIQQLAHQHTMIIIAHRLSTVRNADIIFVLEHGTIVEQGTHEELILKQGQYATLWNLQSKESL